MHKPIDITGEFLSISSKHSLVGSLSICLPFIGQSDGNILQNHPCENANLGGFNDFCHFYSEIWESHDLIQRAYFSTGWLNHHLETYENSHVP